MDAYRNPEISPSARAMSLVRKHHGLTSKSGAPIPEALDRKGNVIRGGWRREASMNHLHARRRRLPLEQIREEEMPVILEVNEGRNFVILCETAGEESFRVQFPDTRESIVTAGRLADVYDGHCILLSPRRGGVSSHDEPRGGGGGFWRRLFRGEAPSKNLGNTVLTLLLNGGVIVGTLWLVNQHGMIFDQLGASGGWLATFAGVIAAMIVLGLSKLRGHLAMKDSGARRIDCAFVPLMLTGVWLMSGLPVIYLFGSALMCGAYLFYAKASQEAARFGRVLFGAAFIVGGLAAWACVTGGSLRPAVLTGVFVLGAYLARVLLDGAHFWPRARLA